VERTEVFVGFDLNEYPVLVGFLVNRNDFSRDGGHWWRFLRLTSPEMETALKVTIDPGVDFVEAVEEVVSACDVLIAVIGSRWLTSSDRRDRRRLDIPEDLVRLEIATALKRGIRAVPVLVEGATMPEASELPDDLKPWFVETLWILTIVASILTRSVLLPL
jgi:hypothetical protein